MADAENKILTPDFRVAFPSVFSKRKFGEGDPKYWVTMLFPPDADLGPLRDAAREALEEKWPNPDKRPKNLNDPFRNGDDVEWDGFAGTTFVRASSLYAPGVIDRRKERITDEELFYAGCWARATVNAFAYDKKGNRGVSFGIRNIQFLRDDEPFTGRTAPEEDFDDLPEVAGDGAMTPDDLGDMG